MILEYVWLDANNNFRSKLKVDKDREYLDVDWEPQDFSKWSFDGSSTGQAPGDKSDCVLNPVAVYRGSYGSDRLIWCEVEGCDSNKRNDIKTYFEEGDNYWFGFEQEYVIYKNGKPLGWPEDGEPEPQGPYYCGVGSKTAGESLAFEHLQVCINMGLEVTGINAEVMLGQWEYQLLTKGSKSAADDLWVSRYMLEKIAGKYNGWSINWHPKPVEGDWNGSGLHTNFSTEDMRNTFSKKRFIKILERFKERHLDHIAVYGKDNHKRLTGLHETQSIDKFTYGVSDRGASVRIPLAVVDSNWTSGYLEDRRPASNANPYEIVKAIIDTLEYRDNTGG